jgi:predicted phosphodiesterase
MKVAIISDVHSNEEALTAVYNTIETLGVERIYCLGDIIGYGPDPIKIIQMIREKVYACILGNHDEAAMIEPKYFNRIPYEAIMWTKIQLSYRCEDELQYLSTLPAILKDEGMVFTHGLLDNNMCYVDNTDDLLVIFERMEADDIICFGGHSHFPSVWSLNNDGQMSPIDLKPGQSFQMKPEMGKLWVNVGSVGQPRDGDNRSSFMTWDTESRTLTYHRIEYDFKTTMGKIRKIPELDNFLAERLEKGV